MVDVAASILELGLEGRGNERGGCRSRAGDGGELGDQRDAGNFWGFANGGKVRRIRNLEFSMV